MLVLLGIAGFIIGASVFIGAGVIWYYMAKWEYAEPFPVLCPETLEQVEVRIDGTLAARTRFAGHEQLEVVACSRWPEKRGCDQACTPQVPFLGDSRSFNDIAAYGLQPYQLRIFNPVRMTKELYGKIDDQLKQQSPNKAARYGC